MIPYLNDVIALRNYLREQLRVTNAFIALAKRKGVVRRKRRKKKQPEPKPPTIQDDAGVWFCDWCDKAMPGIDEGYSRRKTCFCSKECADEKDANM